MNLIFRHAASLGNAGSLKVGIIWRDVGIEAGTRGRNGVDRNRVAGILRGELVDVALDALYQLRVGLGEIRSAGGGRVVSVARSGGTRVEIAVRGEALCQQFRADDLAVLQDEAARGFVWKHCACDSCHDEWISNAKQKGGQNRETNRRAPNRVRYGGSVALCR